jgi:L-threonylcarbamoyladenylate synthase
MPDALAPALDALRRGKVVLYPTDTLWGLAVRATNARAIERLSELKGRPRGMPVSVAFSSLEEIERFAELSRMARSFLRRNLPGPITALVRPNALGRRRLSAASGGVGAKLGVRIPDHPLARELARRAGPITATSANLHGGPPCPSLSEARRTFGTAVAVYLDGPAPRGEPSSIVDLTAPGPRPVRRS